MRTRVGAALDSATKKTGNENHRLEAAGEELLIP